MLKYFLTLLVVTILVAGCPAQVQVPTGGGGGSDSTARAQIANLQGTVSGQASTISGLQSTVSGHTSTIASVQATVNSQATSISALQARPTFTPNGDSTQYLSGNGSFKQATQLRGGTATFPGTAWRLAIYIPGITATWDAMVSPIYSTDTPAIDFLVLRQIKTDSLIVIRQANGTANLAVKYFAVSP